MSLDFSMSPSKGSGLGDRFPGGKPLEQTPTAPTHGQTLSPTLPPMVFTECVYPIFLEDGYNSFLFA